MLTLEIHCSIYLHCLSCYLIFQLNSFSFKIPAGSGLVFRFSINAAILMIFTYQSSPQIIWHLTPEATNLLPRGPALTWTSVRHLHRLIWVSPSARCVHRSAAAGWFKLCNMWKKKSRSVTSFTNSQLPILTLLFASVMCPKSLIDTIIKQKWSFLQNKKMFSWKKCDY